MGWGRREPVIYLLCARLVGSNSAVAEGGCAVRYKLVWPLAGLACAMVLSGMAFLWIWRGDSIGISVGLPVGATLLGPIVAWAMGAQRQPAHSTTEQVMAAKELLAVKVLEEWRGVRRPTRADVDAWRPTFGTLAVRWTASTPGAVDENARSGTDDVMNIAAGLRTQQSRRLIILGDAGSGKTALARSLIVELLEHPQPGDPVPVFLPLTAWDPDRRGLCDWMVHRIGVDTPELCDESSYGPTVVASLVGLGMVLPILDGLDALPKAARLAVLTSDDLLRQDRLVITCRTPQFKEVAEVCTTPDTLVFTPGPVDPEEAMRFLSRATGDAQAWEYVFRISENTGSPLADALSNPRIIYLADAVYKDTRNCPCELASDQANSKPGFVESYLLGKLLPALMPANGSWAPQCPWYRKGALKWLEYLKEKVRDPRTGGIAWWSVFHGTPSLHRFQAIFRAVTTSVIVFAAITLLYKASRFGLLTGLAYALALFSVCFFLSPVDLAATPEFKRLAATWWFQRIWARSWRVLAAGFATLVCFGSVIGYRTAGEYGISDGVRTGRADGLEAAFTVVIGAVIAGLPAQPRSQQAEIQTRQRENDPVASRGATGPSIRRSISSALVLGIAFGLLVGVLTATKHQFLTGPSIGQGLKFGVIIGINFAVGAWLVSWARSRLASGDAPDPLSGFRADRAFFLLAIAILGATFASAFGLDSNLHWDLKGAIVNGLAGINAASLASEWPLYVVSITFLAARRRLPLRFMKFLGFSQQQAVLRPVLQSFQFREDPARTLPAAGKTQLEHIRHVHELPAALPHQRRPLPGAAKTPDLQGGSYADAPDPLSTA